MDFPSEYEDEPSWTPQEVAHTPEELEVIGRISLDFANKQIQEGEASVEEAVAEFRDCCPDATEDVIEDVRALIEETIQSFLTLRSGSSFDE